jgi:pimeloyl-ACP methyl ester carboxylesterase
MRCWHRASPTIGSESTQEVDMAASTISTHTLDVPGAVLAYDIRPNASTQRTLFIIGSPMAASGFGTLAGHFGDRTVVTYDPRGSERSRRTDGADQSTPEEHADDLHRLISTVGGPVDLFATSGGAINALALVAAHPGDVATLVAHEPPAWQVLPDREVGLAAARDIHDTYLRSGVGPAMAKFIALVSFEGELPADYLERPAPDPAMFGLPTQDDGSRDDPLVGQNMISCSHYEPDFDSLRRASTRIVPAIGEESDTVMTGRATKAVAERLGIAPVVFPGGHAGFLGGEFGQMGKPAEFGARLREVLAES